MPRTPKLPKENARYWIDEAHRELRVANDYRGDFDMALIRCARAHAAVELAIKAVIIGHDKGYPDTHNIGLLLERAEQVGETIGDETKQASRLTAYAGRLRYGHLEHLQPVPSPDNSEVDEVIEIANRTVAWAGNRVQTLLPATSGTGGQAEHKPVQHHRRRPGNL